MGRLLDEDDVYITLTDYYHQRTDIQHYALREAISRVPLAKPEPQWIPSAQPEPQWIPCSEKLPEDGRYLCTYENDEGICVDFGRVIDGAWWVMPIAWMPLPEPYKEGEQDG